MLPDGNTLNTSMSHFLNSASFVSFVIHPMRPVCPDFTYDFKFWMDNDFSVKELELHQNSEQMELQLIPELLLNTNADSVITKKNLSNH